MVDALRRARICACGGQVTGGGALGAHIEFDGALELDDGFGMMAIFEQRIADGLRGVDEQAAKEAILFLDDPVAAAIAADKDNGGCRAARWRCDEVHMGIPSGDEWAVRQLHPCSQYLLGRI